MSPGSRSRGRRRLVEVAGVAGSGKSTLAAGLRASGHGHTLAETLRTTEPRHLTALVRGVRDVGAVVLRSLGAGRVPSWVEVKLVLYLAGFGPTLERTPGGRGWIVVDQGPVYALARLLSVERPLPGTAPGTGRWSRWVAAWARRLDLLVLLEAPADVLVARIDQRAQAHEVKRADPVRSAAFVARYATAYAQATAAVAAAGVPVLRCDTDRHGPDQVLAAVTERLAHLESERAARP